MRELQFIDPSIPGCAIPIRLWGRLRFRFDRGELHFHGCPECYLDGPCAMDCEAELDLSPEGEPLRGCHALCDACRIFSNHDDAGEDTE